MTTDKYTDVDRVIDAKELCRIVPVSNMHIWRMERAGKFPARIRLGSKKVGWILSEVMAWVEVKKDERGATSKPAPEVPRGVHDRPEHPLPHPGVSATENRGDRPPHRARGETA